MNGMTDYSVKSLDEAIQIVRLSVRSDPRKKVENAWALIEAELTANRCHHDDES